MPSKDVPLVGVTGGIGSGKSAVCACFSALGRTVLSADDIARGLTESNPQVRRSIAEKFGREIYGPGGDLRRRELAAIVFSDPAKLRSLNEIVHPLVFSTLNDAIDRLPASSRLPYVVVEAALVFESGMDKRLDVTIVVRSPEELRIERVIRRDGLPREAILARMGAQKHQEETARRADFVIENSGPEEGLAGKVAFVDSVLTRMFAARTA